MIQLSKFRKLAATAVLAATLSFGGLPTTSASAETLHVATHAELTSLDPIWTTAYIVRNHGFLVYDTLFGTDEMNEPQPQMVDHWTTSDDGKTWTFTLRDGLKWHDGTPVTAEDCVASLKRWGKRDGIGQRLFDDIQSLKADDDKTFTMQLKKPSGIVLRALAKNSVNVPFMMPKRIAETDPYTQITDPTGSGPYIYNKEESVPGTKIVYDRNEDYVPRSEPGSMTAGGKVASVDSIEWDYFPDQKEAVQALADGKIGYMESPATALVPDLQSERRVIVASTDPLGNIAMIRFNSQQPPFDNAKVRRAVLMALQQDSYMKAAFGDNPPEEDGLQYWRNCYSIYPCGTDYADEEGSDVMKTASVAAAKKALADAGYDGTPVVIMDPVDNPVISALTNVTVDRLKEIGMKVDVQDMRWDELIQRRANRGSVADGGWNLFHTWWQAVDLMDPLSIAFSGNAETGWYGWPSDAKLEEYRDAFANATTDEEKYDLAVKVQKRIWEIGSLGVLGQFFEPVAYRDDVAGITTAPIQLYWKMTEPTE